MSVTEETIAEDVQTMLPGAAQEGAALIGVPVEASPSAIIRSINEFIANPPKGSWFKKVDNWNERALPLGALWGVQMIRRFDWQWAMIVDHENDGDKVIGVFDARRSMGVHPFEYVFGCLEEGAYPTIELAYNMLEAGQIPVFEDRAYTNLMDGVHHVVPPA
jgi:hypothetical protein